MNNNCGEFGFWLRGELAKRNMTQTDLANLLGCSRARISAMIIREESPRVDTIYKVAEAIGADPHSFLINQGKRQPDKAIKKTRLMTDDDFLDWLACSVILESDWEENPGFYREVICRKLVRIGKVKIDGDNYVLNEP